MSGPSFLALDFETTGLDAGRCRVVEIGAIRFRLEPPGGGGPARPVEEASLAALVDPGVRMPAAARAVHGISDADLAGAPVFGELAAPLLSLAAGATIVAHNVGFDLGFLRAELARLGLAAPRASSVDTVALARRAFPGLPSYSLGPVASALGIERGRGHRAVDDARACMFLYAACAAALGAAGGTSGAGAAAPGAARRAHPLRARFGP